jgi:RimJ/RimL family protein N-acetyltransferase
VPDYTNPLIFPQLWSQESRPICMAIQKLDQQGRDLLAGTIGDSPWTVITVHLLHRGLCDAYVEGEPSAFSGAVIQWSILEDEPVAFGEDAGAMWRLLQHVSGWRVINVDETIAPALGAVMERELGRPVRYYGDIHHVLTAPPWQHTHPLVRRLTIDDVALIEEAPPLLQQGRGFGGPAGLLGEGIVAGAIDAGRLVAIAHTSSMTERYADIGVATLEPYRRQGISAAAASLVCSAVQERGRTPVWSCGEDNLASLRVAEKIGFTNIGKRVYVIPGEESRRTSRRNS